MNTTILHDGALTVELESSGTVILKVAGKLPTSNHTLPHFCEVDDISESDQIWLDTQGEL
jgi:hypothetical protein